MKIKKIFFFTTEPFPFGFGGTNRILAYAKGFNTNGIDVEVVCIRRTEKGVKILNNEINGIYNNIKFRYLSKNTIRSKFLIKRKLDDFFSYIQLLLYSIKELNRNTFSIFYSHRTTPAVILFITNKIRKGVLFKEESEHPEIRSKSNFSMKVYKTIHYKLFDGFLVISKNLISYIKSKTNMPIIQVPMLVELDRFNKKDKINNKSNEIVYTGLIDDKKDGIDILFKAFSEVIKKHKSLELTLYGSAKSEIKLQEFYKLAEKLKIKDLVNFKGRVSRDVITEKLLGAKILVLPRPDSVQAQNGFPTKLGEYLATGNPTIVTNVGEIPDYLIDNKDVYIATPSDVLSFKNKLLEVIEDYPKAKKIGLEGRKTADVQFNSIYQTKKIIHFIEREYKLRNLLK